MYETLGLLMNFFGVIWSAVGPMVMLVATVIGVWIYFQVLGQRYKTVSRELMKKV